jgi:hypothetical protein
VNKSADCNVSLLISVCRQQWEIQASHCCPLPFNIYCQCGLTHGISHVFNWSHVWALASCTWYNIGIAPLCSNTNLKRQECWYPKQI